MDAMTAQHVVTLQDLGQAFDALSKKYQRRAGDCEGLIANSEKAMTEAGIRYGSREWSSLRFTECGQAIREANALLSQLDEVSGAIGGQVARSLPDLLIKAKAHIHDGAPKEILTDIQKFIASAQR